MRLKAFIGICAALLFFGVPGALPQEVLPKVPSKEKRYPNFNLKI